MLVTSQVLGFTRDPRKDTADPPDDQIDLHSRTGRLRYLIYKSISVTEFIFIRIRPLLPLVISSSHQLQDFLFQAGWRYDEVPVFSVQIGDRHVFKNTAASSPDRLVPGQKRKIGVHFRRLLIIVSGSDLSDISDGVFYFYR